MKTRQLSFNIKVSTSEPTSSSAEIVVLPSFEEGTFPSYLNALDKKLGGLLSRKVKRDRFLSKAEQSLLIDTDNPKMPKFLLIGLGKRKNCDRSSLRNAYGAAASSVMAANVSKAAVAVVEDVRLKKELDAALEGFFLSTYRFDKYLKKSEVKTELKDLEILVKNSRESAAVQKTLKRIEVFVNATFMARDLVNEPANVVHPSSFEKHASEVAKSPALTMKVLGEIELNKLGMNLLLAVGQGSSRHQARLIHLEYKPKNKKKGPSVALVGKGVTFDSGGYSLKPQGAMYGMKSDMSGAASVMGAMWGISQLKPNMHVHGIIPLVENLIGGKAIKPGDIFVGKNGKSVEVENTDAEGRLILADAVSYADSIGADTIIDTATLTGACVIALGEDIAALFTKDTKLSKGLQAAAEKSGEKFWELPLEKSYKRMLKSNVADLKNVGGRYGGSITAALFIAEFVDKARWAHLDIAGPAFIDRKWPISAEGGTGFGVRTFLELVTAKAI